MTKTKTKQREADLLSATQQEFPSEYGPAEVIAAAIDEPEPKAKNALKVVERTGPLQDASATEVAMLMKASTDPNVDLEKFNAIDAAIERRRALMAEAAFDVAFIDLQEELPVITKDGRIDMGTTRSGKEGVKTRYATYPNIQQETRPILRNHKFALKHTVQPGKNDIGLLIVSTLSFGTHKVMAELPLKLETGGAKNDIQGAKSSIEYAKRINTILLLDLISLDPKDDDNNGFARAKKGAKPTETEAQEDSDAKITMEQAIELKKKIVECGLTDERFCASFKIEAPTDLPAAAFKSAITRCENYKQQAAQSTR